MDTMTEDCLVKKVSVVVPCHNMAEFIPKCVDSLLRQTLGAEHIEIILVDDASTDDGATWQVITNYESKYPDYVIAVSLDQNMRPGGTRNIGIDYASGEYLFFLDSDDWLLPEALEHLYRTATETDADVVECLFKNTDNRNLGITEIEKGDCKSFLTELNTEKERKKFLMKIDSSITLGSQNKLYRLSVIRENNIRFAEHLAFEEPSFSVPLRFYIKRYYFLSEKLYVYYHHAGSATTGDWTDCKWDNPQIWLHILQELKERNVLKKYFNEIEYYFASWYLGLTLKLLAQKSYEIETGELRELQETVLKNFPHVLHNTYLNRYRRVGNMDDLILKVLNLEICDESVAIVNRILRSMFGAR